MDSIAQEIVALAQIAGTSPKKFRHWVTARSLTPDAITVAQLPDPAFNPVIVSRFKVPEGHSLLITRMSHYVSYPNAAVPTQPGVVNLAVDPKISFEIRAAIRRMRTPLAAKPLLVGSGRVFLIFPSSQLVDFLLVRNAAQGSNEYTLHMRLEGFLTEERIARKLDSLQSVLQSEFDIN